MSCQEVFALHWIAASYLSRFFHWCYFYIVSIHFNVVAFLYLADRLVLPLAVPPAIAQSHSPALLPRSCPEPMTRSVWEPSPRLTSIWWGHTVVYPLVGLFLLFGWLFVKATPSLTLPPTASILRRRWSFPDGPGGFGHVPRHPNMHCVLPEWCCVHRKGSRAVGEHKGACCRYPLHCLSSDVEEIPCLSHLCCCSQGICFIRTSRPETAVIYSPHEKFEVGVAKVIIYININQWP